MRCLKKLPDASRFLRLCQRYALRVLPTLAFCFYALAASAGGIDIQNPQLSPAEEGGYALSADFHIDFNARLEEAVTRGVPLTFVLEFELERPRWYWSDELVASKSQTWRLSYHALTRQYRLSTGSLHQSFSTLENALQFLAHIRNFQVVEGNLKVGERYRANLRLRLDISQLPKPFQVSAFTNRDWNLDSEWARWKFVVPPPASTPAAVPAESEASPTAAEQDAR
ncbi:MAG: DUF4390 domain-containing protein [Zoogloeaceae bacterium]|nr:DUF4390 domain-containing protein [Zoogloeaceae bacterium]